LLVYCRINLKIIFSDWGTWTFSDTSRTDLATEDGDYEVEVEFVAPIQKEK